MSKSDNECKKVWQKIENFTNVIDTFRATNKTKRMYTFVSPTNSKSRIDKIFIPNDLASKLISTKLENVPVSDHKIVITKFKQEIDKGPGIYIFNNSLLDDPIFVQGILDIINKYALSERDFDSYISLWEFLKMNLTDFSRVD